MFGTIFLGWCSLQVRCCSFLHLLLHVANHTELEYICSLANNIVTRIVLFHYSSFWKGWVFLFGFEPLKSVLLFLLKATPGKLSVCSPALASGDVKTGVQLFICINRKKYFILSTAKSLQRLLLLC